jgi:hypothetical protein
VNHRGGFWGGVATMDSPGAHFLLTRREIGLESEQLVTGLDQAVETGRFEPERSEEVSSILRR